MAALLGILLPAARAAEPFELRDGDRVVFVGSTLIERDQSYGYLETLLTILHPDRNIAFRNLGWSGDNVFGAARARFGPVSEGYQHLQQHIESLKPTVVFVAYGTNESFEGRAGLPSFLEGLNTLLDMIAKSGARIVLISPHRQEDLGRPLPDPRKHNEDLKLYVEALRSVAEKRGHRFLNLFDGLPVHSSANDDSEPLTDDGLHLTEYGYWVYAQVVAQALDLPDREWKITVRASVHVEASGVAKVSGVEHTPDHLRFRVKEAMLPFCAAPNGHKAQRALGWTPGVNFRFMGSDPAGKYTLKLDGKPSVSFEWSGSDGEATIGHTWTDGPAYKRVERLRRTINAKNLLYFHRWRPQNETYLFGFRKHEQGQNAREVPQFDPLVAKLEEEIASLRKPVPYTFEITREGDKDR
jgi:lysophospholipase L1-like esterase